MTWGAMTTIANMFLKGCQGHPGFVQGLLLAETGLHCSLKLYISLGHLQGNSNPGSPNIMQGLGHYNVNRRPDVTVSHCAILFPSTMRL
jgi:hypothetical protein